MRPSFTNFFFWNFFFFFEIFFLIDSEFFSESRSVPRFHGSESSRALRDFGSRNFSWTPRDPRFLKKKKFPNFFISFLSLFFFQNKGTKWFSFFLVRSRISPPNSDRPKKKLGKLATPRFSEKLYFREICEFLYFAFRKFQFFLNPKVSEVFTKTVRNSSDDEKNAFSHSKSFMDTDIYGLFSMPPSPIFHFFGTKAKLDQPSVHTLGTPPPHKKCGGPSERRRHIIITFVTKGFGSPGHESMLTKRNQSPFQHVKKIIHENFFRLQLFPKFGGPRTKVSNGFRNGVADQFRSLRTFFFGNAFRRFVFVRADFFSCACERGEPNPFFRFDGFRDTRPSKIFWNERPNIFRDPSVDASLHFCLWKQNTRHAPTKKEKNRKTEKKKIMKGG